MSKYDPLWNYLKTNRQPEYQLSFAEIEQILGFKIDHSFLTYKKELLNYGYQVRKISMKNKTIIFDRLGDEKVKNPSQKL